MTTLQSELARFRGSKLVRNAGWLFAGQGLGLVLQAAYFVMLARLLGPVQYGVFAGAFAFASLVAQYSPLGMGTVFLRYVTNDRASFAVYWGNILVVTTVVGGALVVALDLLGPKLLNPASAALVLFAAIANCVFGQLTIESARVFQTFEQMRLTALLNLLTSLVRTAAAAGMLVTMHHATAYQWALVAMLVSAAASVATVATITLRFGMPSFSFKLFAGRSAEGSGYAVAMSTSSLYNDLDKIMLSHYGLNLANGIYSMAYRIVDIATIPIFSIRDAAMPRFFQTGRTGLAGPADLARRLLRRAVPLAALASVVMFVAAPLVPRVAGHGFAEGVLALRWLCLIPLFRSIHQMTGCALTGAGMQRYRTCTQFLAAAMNFCLNVWLIPRWGWRGAAWSSLATDLSLVLMNTGILQFQLGKESAVPRVSGILGKFSRPMQTLEGIRVRLHMAVLILLNRFGNSLVATGKSGPVVSLTTYGKRYGTVHLTIESIARGRETPSQLILWLDDVALYKNLSKPLVRLQKRGLKILLCNDYGPHKKYYPYVEGQTKFKVPLITADDDVIYPRTWLTGLIAAHERFPKYVNCYRARVMFLQDGKIAPYREWPLCESTDPSNRVVATGISGVIYPPALLKVLKRAGTDFENKCPRADDLWLHVQAIRSGFLVRQIQPEAIHFPNIPGTQTTSLYAENCEKEDGNDRQSSATYESRDLELVRSS